MKPASRALATVAIAAAIPVAVVAAVAVIRDASITEALSNPAFWVVEGITALAAGLASLDHTDDEPGAKPQPPNPWTHVARNAAAAAAIAALIGVLLGVATDTPIMTVLTSRPFLLGAGIAVVVTALEAWPDNNKEPNRQP